LHGPLLFLAGFLALTLVEYIMHRFVFHLKPEGPRSEKFAYTVHGVHHEYPKDKDRLAMPIPLSLVISTMFYFIFFWIMGNLVYGFLPGFLMGYATYLWVHYSVHAFKPPKNFLKILWIHHGIHHYKDPDHAFGVSSPLWDYIFGTMPKK
jgi:sterol desaturase/sphingolipid hydroxylase (fatty acid hydroxylase superfamily)